MNKSLIAQSSAPTVRDVNSMSDKTSDGIHLTKDYYKDFMPSDLQWEVSKVADDFTLYDLFFLVYRMELIVPGIARTFGMPEFEAFWDQIQLDRDPDDIDDVEYLQLYWSLDYDTLTVKRTTPKKLSKACKRLGFPDDKDYWDDPKVATMRNLMSFHGIGPHCHVAEFDSDNLIDSHVCEDDDRCIKDSGYGIEFSPLNNLAHLPIRVSPQIEFFPPYVEPDRDFKRTGFTLTIEPTLYCFITSIFWELTFCGFTPNDVADKRDDLMSRVDEAKAHFKNLDKEDNKSDD
ncbi:hypothetical protein LCGC14_0140930 [marine sediment metagenome]|uniref:Uncharacterized protein n=1 Tax=marine sediment metagenome TaxID=412755 RepID=A0A0F9VGA3_9ZZZZ